MTVLVDILKLWDKTTILAKYKVDSVRQDGTAIDRKAQLPKQLTTLSKFTLRLEANIKGGTTWTKKDYYIMSWFIKY